MTSLVDDWRAQTEARIRDTLTFTEAALAPVGAYGRDLTEVLTVSARGGKRMRALLLLASHAAYGAPEHEAAVDAAAALELFQTAALLHDDVLDDSDTRRGQPAAHVRLAAAHRDSRWEGDSDQFGAAGAVLAGDLALMSCHRAAHAAFRALPAAWASQAADLFVTMTELVTAGQYADMRAAVQTWEALPSQEDEIRAVMRSKTASYTAEFPLALGAALAGADSAQVASMREIGVDIGVAFQLRDDVLGLIGEPSVTGKPAGDDIREGKRTVLVWHAWKHTDTAGREALRAALGDRHASTAAVERAVAVITASGAFDVVEHEVRERSARAGAALDTLGLNSRGCDVLSALITQAVARSA